MYTMDKMSQRFGGDAALHPQGTNDQLNQDSVVNWYLTGDPTISLSCSKDSVLRLDSILQNQGFITMH